MLPLQGFLSIVEQTPTSPRAQVRLMCLLCQTCVVTCTRSNVVVMATQPTKRAKKSLFFSCTVRILMYVPPVSCRFQGIAHFTLPRATVDSTWFGSCCAVEHRQRQPTLRGRLREIWLCSTSTRMLLLLSTTSVLPAAREALEVRVEVLRVLQAQRSGSSTPLRRRRRVQRALWARWMTMLLSWPSLKPWR